MKFWPNYFMKFEHQNEIKNMRTKTKFNIVLVFQKDYFSTRKKKYLLPITPKYSKKSEYEEYSNGPKCKVNLYATLKTQSFSISHVYIILNPNSSRDGHNKFIYMSIYVILITMTRCHANCLLLNLYVRRCNEYSQSIGINGDTKDNTYIGSNWNNNKLNIVDHICMQWVIVFFNSLPS